MPRFGQQERSVFLKVKAACSQGLGTAALLETLHENFGPALRADATGTVVLDRLGLTPREEQVTLAVIRGEDLNQFARRHVLLYYTVGEQLRCIPGKRGVSSRPELAAWLMSWS